MYRYTLNIFKDMYYHELTIKEALNSRVSVPLTTLSIVATLIVYYVSKSESLPFLSFSNILLCFYYCITSIIVILVIVAAVVLAFIFHGHKYCQSPSTKEIDNYVKQLEQNCNDCAVEEREREIAKEFNSYMNELYRDATDENGKNNRKKMKYIRWANICIITALVLCIVNAILLFILNKSIAN